MIKKILIANRGEIACSVIKTAQLLPLVIGRLDRPTHMAKVASSIGFGRMGHPIKSGDDVVARNEFGRD
ncbi:hypothetical protein N9W89_09730 [Hellea sp.]|nr:hypothetical protein [Hellea sp.]